MRFSLIFFLCLMLLSPLTARAQEEEQPPYFELDGPAVLAEADDGRIEVISFFWYGCGTCSRIDSTIGQWAEGLPKDVRFTRKHVVFNPPVDVHARVFATLRVLGLDHAADLKVFNIFLGDRKPINTLMDLPRLAAALKIDEKKLIEAFESKEVDNEMAALNKLMDAYNIDAVPSLVIDGRYVFNIGMTKNGPQGFLQQADELIEKRRQARRGQGG